MHRLPRLEGQRQQRHHGPAADAGDELPQLHRPLLLGGRRRARPGGRRRHRARGAAGGHRQHAAPARLPRLLREARRAPRRACSTPTSIPARTSATRSCTPSASRRSWPSSCAANTSTPPAARTACASSTSPSSTTRASPSGSSPRRSRRWASGSTCRRSYATAVAAPTTIAPDPTRTQPPENREATVHAMYGISVRRRQVRGADPRRRRHDSRRQPAEQLPQARADLQPGRLPQRGQQPSPSSAPTPTSAATPAWWSSASTIRRTRWSPTCWARICCISPRRGGPVPLRLRLRRGGHQGARRDRPGPSRAGREDGVAGRPQHLPGADLRLRRRRQRTAWSSSTSRTRSSRRSTRSTRRRARSTTCTT